MARVKDNAYEELPLYRYGRRHNHGHLADSERQLKILRLLLKGFYGVTVDATERPRHRAQAKLLNPELVSPMTCDRRDPNTEPRLCQG